MSIAGGVNLAIERARSINCTAMQMFVKNNMQWFARPLARDEIRSFQEQANAENYYRSSHTRTISSISPPRMRSFTQIRFARYRKN